GHVLAGLLGESGSVRALNGDGRGHRATAVTVPVMPSGVRTVVMVRGPRLMTPTAATRGGRTWLAFS
ncbi:MAG TPA: hypothetical protein VJT72_08105, partial [Pseudonocardiaceae bacterium]|nr:hypothetical protein [Pseudonocardiaceae bacterium]